MCSSKNSTERLNALVKYLLLRRTKSQACPVTNKPLVFSYLYYISPIYEPIIIFYVELKPKNEEIIKLELEGLEKRCYDIMFEASK